MDTITIGMVGLLILELRENCFTGRKDRWILLGRNIQSCSCCQAVPMCRREHTEAELQGVDRVSRVYRLSSVCNLQQILCDEQRNFIKHFLESEHDKLLERGRWRDPAGRGSPAVSSTGRGQRCGSPPGRTLPQPQAQNKAPL